MADGEGQKYAWEPFGRLRKVINQSDDVVAECTYNGLGDRIAENTGTDLARVFMCVVALGSVF